MQESMTLFSHPETFPFRRLLQQVAKMMNLFVLNVFLMRRLTNVYRMDRMNEEGVRWSNQKVYNQHLIALWEASKKGSGPHGATEERPHEATEETAMFKDGNFCLWWVTLDTSWQISIFGFKGIRKHQKRFRLTWPNSHTLKKEMGP